MPDIIKLLPDSIANQIAAGEVIQRPASVVKELMENALDAGADTIQVIVKDAGKTLVQIVDNGSGMSGTDARMSFERHATSKIRSAGDLFAIRSMGFRGEALASIAAVAQVELRTRQADDTLGTRIVIEGSAVITQEACQAQPGTSLWIKNLFFNVPARRKFLKSDPVEFRHLLEEFSRIALAHPEIAFSLHHNDSEVAILPKSNLRQRIVNLLGKKYNELLVPVSEETNYVGISGFAGKPESAKRTRGEQYLYVNHRFIKSPYLHHAVRSAFEEMIPDDAHPMYVLFLEVDPARIDINVHPTKQEIKFEDERLIYNYLRVSIRHALGKYSVMPVLDFEQEVAFVGTAPGPAPAGVSPLHPSAPQAQRDAENLRSWQTLYEGLSQQASSHSDTALLPDTSADDVHVSPETLQIHGTYIVAQTRSGLLVIDQQVAHQRVLYERYLGVLSARNGAVQKLLFPETFELTAVEAAALTTMMDDVRAIGFEIEAFGGQSFILHGIPAQLQDQRATEVVHRMLDTYMHDTGKGAGMHEKIARAMSMSAAITPGTRMNAEERQTLIDTLFACENPYTGPSGHKCFVILELNDLQRRLA